MSPDSRAAREVKRWLRVLVATTVVLYLALGGLFLSTRRDSTATRGALCALRADLDKRVQSSRDFLKANPDGAAGIPASVVRDSIVNQKQTVAVLSGLHCR